MYNAEVPTPFYHLSLANELLEHSDLPAQVREVIGGQVCAFYFGKTAPDVQTISGQPRPDTHFYWLPLIGQLLPWKQMLRRHPNLAAPGEMSAAQATFIAGYLCHLQADILWIEMISMPFFIGPVGWKKSKQERILLHNVLRAHLDEEVLKGLPPELGTCLERVEPDGWLPMVENHELLKWRDYLAEQLSPQGVTQTIEVFAARQGISVEEFSALLHTEERLEAELFSFVPRDTLVEYRQTVIAENLQLLWEYFSGAL